MFTFFLARSTRVLQRMPFVMGGPLITGWNITSNKKIVASKEHSNLFFLDLNAKYLASLLSQVNEWKNKKTTVVQALPCILQFNTTSRHQICTYISVPYVHKCRAPITSKILLCNSSWTFCKTCRDWSQVYKGDTTPSTTKNKIN